MSSLAETILGFDVSADVMREMQEHRAVAEREAAEECRDLAKRLAPRRTGNLASTIVAPGDGSVHAGGMAAPYAWAVHWGSEHNPVARPFMTQAFEAARDKFVERLKKV